MLCPEVWNFSRPACNFKFRRGNFSEIKEHCSDVIDLHYFNYLVNSIDFQCLYSVTRRKWIVCITGLLFAGFRCFARYNKCIGGNYERT